MHISPNNLVGLIIGFFLCGFTMHFVGGFLVKAFRLRGLLERSIHALEKIAGDGQTEVTDLDKLASKAMAVEPLRHLWREYAKTLHAQREIGEKGRTRVERWRATTLAETFFTEQVLVDSPLNADYFKHLPGVLTGIGILGTFSGLILGLQHFDISHPEQSATQLEQLFTAVRHAFVISASAIFLAMAITFVEKNAITRLYRKVERLQQQINRMFTTGAGDEYLERVVRATETSATQAIQLKDSLVADLKQILSELTNQQVEASKNHSKLISIDVGAAVAESLRPPMEKISEAVTKVGANQGEAVTKLVMDVLASFSGQMREMFGGQMSGMGELLQATNAAMQSTASKFEQLAGNMDSIGKGAAEAMSERLTQAIVAMESRQQLLNQQMTEFVQQIRALVGQSQTEASQKLQETLATLGEQVSSVVAELQSRVVSAANSHDEQVSRMRRETGAMMGSVSREMERLMEQSTRTNQALQATVSALASSTQDSIGRMNSGAEMLYAASSDFARAGQGVNESIRLSSDAVGKMREVSQSLVGASNTTQQVSAEYARSRDVFAVMVSELKSTVENARREASMTTEVLGNLRGASEQLSAAQKQAEAYLAGISAVLAKAHEVFAGSIENTLRRGNADFHKHLGDAVALLSSGIQDLGDALDRGNRAG